MPVAGRRLAARSGRVEVVPPGDGAGDGVAALVLAVPLLAVQAGAGEEGGDALLVGSHPEGEHGAEGEVGLGVGGVSRAVARPESREPLSAPGAHRPAQYLGVRGALGRRIAVRGRFLCWDLLLFRGEEAGVERLDLLLPGFDAMRSTGRPAPGDGEEASPVVHLYAALAVASRRQFGLDDDVQAGAAR